MLPAHLLKTLPRLLPEQDVLQPPVPTVLGSVDYRTWRAHLERIDEILRTSRAEELFVRLALARRQREAAAAAAAKGETKTQLSAGEQVRVQRRAAVALRVTVARRLTGEGFRPFAARLADSSLLQWFCRLSRLDPISIPGKSELHRFQEMASEEDLRQVVRHVLDLATKKDSPLELEQRVDLATQFLDSTCVRLNIHYPTDWVLLRDATRTLMKATILIRKRGLKVRMKEPNVFLRRMNQLAMAMSRQGRRGGQKQARKKTLRAMKRQVKIAAEHARRHRDLLEKHWAKTDLSRREAQLIIERIDTLRERLPQAIRQAHERIIGGRQVLNEEKILSLYEGHAAVYVRGKAGADVEFGSQLLVAEARNGVLTDWELVCGNPEHDTALLRRSLERDEAGRLKTVVADRGFDSKAMRDELKERRTGNAIAPRDPAVMRTRRREARFCDLQQRRGQTEARIAIIKKDFLGAPLLSKGHENQARQVAWSVLAHNLWLLAGLPTQRKSEIRKAA